MVPVDSHRISRVPHYSGFLLSHNSFVYRAITVSRSSFPPTFLLTITLNLEVLQPHKRRNVYGLGSSLFDRLY